VFKDWKDDTKEMIDECLDHDFALWKLPGFVKDVEEQKKIMEVMKENGDLLKNLFV